MILRKKRFKWIDENDNYINNVEQLINEIIHQKPIKYFIEPFAGGISTSIKVIPLLLKHNVRNIIVNNVNETVVNTYNYIRDNIEEIFSAYWEEERKFNNLVKINVNLEPDKLILELENYYNFKKKEYNKNMYENSIKQSSLFLFLVNRSLNLLYSVNSKEEYIAPFCKKTHTFEKEQRYKTFLNYSILFNKFNVVFERMNHFDFINKYKKEHKESIFYFDPDYTDNFIDIHDKNNKLMEAEQISFIQFYKLFDNLIIKDKYIDDINKATIEYIGLDNYKGYYFKF